jgi:hypothetical protein
VFVDVICVEFFLYISISADFRYVLVGYYLGEVSSRINATADDPLRDDKRVKAIHESLVRIS